MAEQPQANEVELRMRIKSGSKDPDDFLDLAGCLYLQSRYEEALSVLGGAPSHAFSNVQEARILNQYGEYLRDLLGHLEEAAGCAQRSIALLQTEPEGSEVLAFRGCSHALYATILAETDPVAAKQEAAKALDDLERALSANIQTSSSNGALGCCAHVHADRDFERTVEHAQRYMQLDLEPRERLHGLTNLGLAYYMTGRLQEAEKILSEALEQADSQDPELSSTLYQLGEVQAGLGRFLDARKTPQRAISSFHSRPATVIGREIVAEARISLLEVLCELHETEEAAREYANVLEDIQTISIPRKADALLRLGSLKQRRQSFAEARKLFAEVVQLPTAFEDQRTQARQKSIVL